MGLLDILNGMQNGPRGPSTPSQGEDKGGMSPITMAILALLAYKAMKQNLTLDASELLTLIWLSAVQASPASQLVSVDVPKGVQV